jgi:hypothetical protein
MPVQLQLRPRLRPSVERPSVDTPGVDRSDAMTIWSPMVLVAVATYAVALSGIRGADYPAHYVRALLWERSGASAWSNLWYAGHSTPGYSVLAPALMSAIGPFGVVAAGVLLSTWCFTHLTRDLLPGRHLSLTNHAFAVAVTVNVVVGRAPFALGLGLALLSILLWSRSRVVAGVVAAVTAPLVSPVAGVFLAIAGLAVLVASLRSTVTPEPAAARTRRREAIAVTLGAIGPIAVIAALFNDSARWFPFRGGHLIATVAAFAAVALAIRPTVARCGAVIAIVTALALFIVPNQLGGNYVRFGHMIAVPLTIAALAEVRRRQVLVPFAVFAVAGLAWSVQPGVVAALDWWGDESVDEPYYRPLVAQVRARNLDGQPLGRLEIPFTTNHWESYFVAIEVPFARGWERQIDIGHNAVLYERQLGAAEYRAWLHDNGVRWVAIPDAPLDEAGMPEAAVVIDAARGGEPWLREVWSNDHWRLFEIVGYAPIVEAPAELLEQGTDSLLVRVDRAATVTLRYRYSEYLTIDGGACVEPDQDGWIVAELPAAGEYRLAVDPPAVLLGTATGVCG